MGFSRQESWSGLPFPSPGDLPDPGIKPRSPALQADALPSEPPGKLRSDYFKLSPEIRSETRCWLLSFLFNILLEVSAIKQWSKNPFKNITVVNKHTNEHICNERNSSLLQSSSMSLPTSLDSRPFTVTGVVNRWLSVVPVIHFLIPLLFLFIIPLCTKASFPQKMFDKRLECVIEC